MSEGAIENILDEDVIKKPVVISFTEHAGRFLVEFDYDFEAVRILKSTVPGPMRRWITKTGRWEVSAEWAGPLSGALVNAGFGIAGLGYDNIQDWFGPFAEATPTSQAGHDAYRSGRCKNCLTEPHRPGGVECHDCFRDRLISQHRVKAAIGEAPGLAYPTATSSAGKSITFMRVPIELGLVVTDVRLEEFAPP